MTTPLSPELSRTALRSCVNAGCVVPLVTYLARVPDPRKAQGKRHPLPAMLLLLCCALLCGVRTLQAVADWGRDHPEELTRALGFTRPKTPCCATLHNLLAELDWTAFETQLRAWVQAVEEQLASSPPRTPGECRQPEAPAEEALAIDGKTLRGALKMNAAVVSLVSALGHRLGITFGLGQVKDGDEIAAVEELLKNLVLTGKVVTLDALHTQRETAQQIIDGGGDYVMIVKGNQPQLRAAIRRLLAPESTAPDRQTAHEQDDSHGRFQSRFLQAVSVPEGELDWPGAEQVFVVERLSWRGKHHRLHREVVYGVASLKRERADAANLLGRVKGHWTIENRSHWIRDVVFGEDACLIAKGRIPQTLALLRTLAISCLRLAGINNIARETRRLAAQPWRCLPLLGLPPEN